MEEGMKNKIVLALGLLTIILFISSIRSCQNMTREKELVNQEMRTRMELEEQVLYLSKRNTDLEQQINQLQEAVNQQETNYQSDQQALNQEVAELREEIERITKLKDSLEKNLKKALAAQGKTR